MATKKAPKKVSAEEKAAKRKARMEALKNRPEGQRPNSKQIDVISIAENSEIRKYACPVKVKGRSIGCMVTSVVVVDGVATCVSESFVPGNITVKVKKGHGNLIAQKVKKGSEDTEEEAED